MTLTMSPKVFSGMLAVSSVRRIRPRRTRASLVIIIGLAADAHTGAPSIILLPMPTAGPAGQRSNEEVDEGDREVEHLDRLRLT